MKSACRFLSCLSLLAVSHSADAQEFWSIDCSLSPRHALTVKSGVIASEKDASAPFVLTYTNFDAKKRDRHARRKLGL
jgi:hypothetical protein